MLDSKKNIRIVFLGCTQYSKKLLDAIKNLNTVSVCAIFSSPEHFNISYSDKPVHNTNYADLSKSAHELKIPYYEIDSVKGKRITDYKKEIVELKPDVILVLGWYYMVPKSIRELATLGAWGIHASVLPKYAGGAPLVWAIINGEQETGVTLFKLDDGVDDGDIIEQTRFPILPTDTILEVYDKATIASEKILQKVFSKEYNIKFMPQDKSTIEIYPQRKPQDGEINLDWPATRMYNFIRAQSPPYPGAFIKTTDGKRLVILKAHVADDF